MPELAGDVVAPAQHFPVDDDADAEPVGDADEHEIAGRRRLVMHRPQLRDGARASGVLDLNRQSGRSGERLAQFHVSPSQRRRMQDPHGRVLDHAGDDDANPLAGVDVVLLLEERPDASSERLHQSSDRDRWKAETPLERLAERGPPA